MGMDTLKKNFEQREKAELVAIITNMLHLEPESWVFKFNPGQRLRALFGWRLPTEENSNHACMTGRNYMPKEINRWAMYPRKASSSPLPESLKMEVTKKADELIETVLKPQHIQPPPENPQFNYIVNIYGKWHQKAYYFCAEYRVGGPNPVQPSFEVKFARMQYAGGQLFHLSYMRYTGQWVQLYTDLTVDECIETIRDDPNFQAI